jgi:hypothetical protein
VFDYCSEAYFVDSEVWLVDFELLVFAESFVAELVEVSFAIERVVK